MQAKVDDWKEFYYCQHLGLKHKENAIQQAKLRAQTPLKTSEATEPPIDDESYTKDGGYIAALVDSEIYTRWLAWIEGQIPLISSECAVDDATENIGRTTPSRMITPDPDLRGKRLLREIRGSTVPKSGPRRSARMLKISKLSDPKRPLRRSVRIAQKQSSGKDGPSSRSAQ